MVHCCLRTALPLLAVALFYFQLIHNGAFQGHKALGLNQELSESNKPEFPGEQTQSEEMKVTIISYKILSQNPPTSCRRYRRFLHQHLISGN